MPATKFIEVKVFLKTKAPFSLLYVIQKKCLYNSMTKYPHKISKLASCGNS